MHARAAQDWDWARFETTFAVPKDFVLLELELVYRDGCFTLQRSAGCDIAKLHFGSVVYFKMVRSLPLSTTLLVYALSFCYPICFATKMWWATDGMICLFSSSVLM